jgi:hypothetical protein
MPWYVAHFDETDHMDGRLLGFGGSFTTGGRLPGLAETWEEMREDLEMGGREIRWNNLGWNKRLRLAEWVSVMPIWIGGRPSHRSARYDGSSGGGVIRTREGRFRPLTAFEAVPFVHSGTPPQGV